LRVITAGSDAPSVMERAARAAATACSISCCDLTPTVFRNLRMLRLKVSSFMGLSRGNCVPV